MDRRKRKTQKAIKTACLELIKEKGFDGMTILDITERADINRGTFYLHFIDKYDMIDQFEKELMGEIEKAFQDETFTVQSMEHLIFSRYRPLVRIFECFKENRDILEILFQTRGTSFIQNRFSEMSGQIFESKLKDQVLFNVSISPTLFFTIISSTIIGIANHWIQGKLEYEPEELAYHLINIIVNGPAKAAGFITGEMIDVKAVLAEGELRG